MKTKLDELASEICRATGVVGAQIALLAQGEVSCGGAGVVRIDTGVPVTPDTLFQIGSTTKVHTAALVMQLVDEGAIGLDVPVREQLPGFRLATEDATGSVTPRHLMSMSSGIDNGPYDCFGPGDDALAGYVAGLETLEPLFAPGRGYGYSNASTNVSGRLVEYVTGQTWEQALRERLLEPAGLADSTTSTENVIVRRHALGHALVDGEPVLVPTWSLPRSMGPAGSTLCSTAGDLVRLAAVFLSRGRPLRGDPVLTAGAVDQMQRPQVEVPGVLLANWWGLGPYGTQWSGGILVGHSGTNLSGSSYLLWSPEFQVAVATTVNTPAGGYPFAKAAFTELFGRHAGLEPPPRPVPQPDLAIDVERFVGVYEMSGTQLRVTAEGAGLALSLVAAGQASPPAPLVPLTPTTFLPTDPVVDGNRGWGLAFLGTEDGLATHLLNGFFCTRRIR